MAKSAQAKKRSGSLLIHLLILLIAAAMGWELMTQNQLLPSAQADHDALAGQVAALQQENDALRADIAEGATDEKMEELARSELGWTAPNEYVFYDKSN